MYYNTGKTARGFLFEKWFDNFIKSAENGEGLIIPQGIENNH